jgi:hypothetical protein
VAIANSNSLVQNARLFALLNLAEADSMIANFEAKYTYNFWRPVTAIRAADTDGNPDTDPDPSWTPLLATPSFPSYPSLHSTVSTASATVLASFFGTDAVSFSLSWEGLPGVTRSYDSFSAAAHEAGQARIWTGFHYSFDISAGEGLGQSVGAYIAQNFLQPITTPPPGGGAVQIPNGKHGLRTGGESLLSLSSALLQTGSASQHLTSMRLTPEGSTLPAEVTGIALSAQPSTIHPLTVDAIGNSKVSDSHASETSYTRLTSVHPLSRASSVDDLFSSDDVRILSGASR